MTKLKTVFSALMLAVMLLSSMAPAASGNANGGGGTYSISGTVYDLVLQNGTGLEGVTVTVSSSKGGSAIDTTVTDINGAYTVNNVPAGVPPVYLGFSKVGYLFTDYYSYNLVNGDMEVVNWNSSIDITDQFADGWIPRTISGTVTNGTTGLAGQDIRIRNGPLDTYETVTTDQNGHYSLSNIPDGHYRIQCINILAGISMVQTQITDAFVSGGDLSGQDFSFSYVYSISGTITDGTNPVQGVLVDAGGGFSATTDASGAYTIYDFPAGSYTLKAFKTGYTFTDPILAVVTTANLSAQNFTATQVLFSVSGTVTVDSKALVGALVDAGDGYVATTDETGSYSLNLLPAGSYTLTPAMLGYTFSPLTLSATVSNANVTGKNFTATVDQPAPASMPNEPVEVNVVDSPNGGSVPLFTTAYNNKLYFQADDGVHGSELWQYDPATQKSSLLKDIYSGNSNNSSRPSAFTVFNNKLYFVANIDITADNYLWVTDGTAAGTTQVSNQPVSTGSDNTDNLLLVLNNKLLYMGNDKDSMSNKLWALDTNGNLAVVPLSPLGGYTLERWQEGYRDVFGNAVYFWAFTQATGKELFKSDGASVTLVKDLDGTAADSNIQNMAVVETNLYFIAKYNTTSPAITQIWKTDGSPANTSMVTAMGGNSASKYINAGFTHSAASQYFFSVTDSADQIYGAAELWSTDGTTTAVIKDFYFSGAPSNVGADATWSAVYNGSIYFRGSDGTNGLELWKSDGTLANTQMVKDIYPSGDNYISEFMPYNGALYFAANDAISGNELWRTDGSLNGTVRVADINPGSESSGPGGFYVYDGKLYFYAFDLIHDLELWSYDSVADSAELAADINQIDASSYPGLLTDLNGLIYFIAEDVNHGRELWVYDPASGDKHIVQDINAGADNSNIESLTPMGGNLYFKANDGNGAALWKLDGTSGVAAVLNDKNGNPISSPYKLVAMDGKLFFGQGSNLWVSNGTPAGTTRLESTSTSGISPAPWGLASDSKDGQYIVINNTLYFSGYDSTNGEELWKTDGTPDGTALVKDIYPGTDGDGIYYMTEMGGKLYFAARSGSNKALWVSDGSLAGTQRVAEINPSGDALEWLNACNGQLYFSADDGTHGKELWASDGVVVDLANPNGTYMVKDITSGIDSSAPDYPRCFQNKLFFRAYSALYGSELFSSDGTEAGTLMLDLNSGNMGSAPQLVVATENALYIVAEDFDFGQELWKSDGDLSNPSGTKRITDINPGSGGSNLYYKVRLGSHLFFSAENQTTGVELYRVDTATNAVYLTKDLAAGPQYGLDSSSSNFFLVSGSTVYYPGYSPTHGAELWKISPLSPPTAFTSTAPLAGKVGTDYSHAFVANGGPVPTYALKIGSGSLPDGLTLGTDGVLSGTPTAVGTFTFTITAANSLGSVDKQVTLKIDPGSSGKTAPTAFTSSQPDTSIAGAVFSYTFVANGSPAPTYALKVGSGSLPDGLTLDATTGVLSGQATAGGTFIFTITASNSEGSIDQVVTLILLVKPTIKVPSNSAVQNQEFSITFDLGSAQTGSITFRDNSVVIANCGSVPLVNNTAECTLDGWLLGRHVLTMEVDLGGSLPAGTLFSFDKYGIIFPLVYKP